MTEFCSGGELFDQVIAQQKLNEAKAAEIIKKVLSVLNHLHDLGIVHRDIKPENLLFENKNEDAEIKLIDFGLAKFKHFDRHL